MTAISRINTAISDHNMTANFIALSLLLCVSVVSAVAITHSGSLAKTSYDTLIQTRPATHTPAIKSSTIPASSPSILSITNSSTDSLQNQPADVSDALQPAQGLHYNTVSVTVLQPSVNTVQLTGGADLQNAESIQ